MAKASESSFVKLNLPKKIWALVFQALARLESGLALSGLGYVEFSDGTNRWTSSISSEHQSVHVYCETSGEQRLLLSRQVEELGKLLRSYPPQIAAVSHLPADSPAELVERYGKQRKALEAAEQKCRRDIDRAKKQLESLQAPMDITILLAPLLELGQGWSIDVPGGAVMDYEQRELARSASLGVPALAPLEVPVAKEFVLAEAGPMCALLAGVVVELTEPPSRDVLEALELGSLQRLAMAFGVDASGEDREVLISGILASEVRPAPVLAMLPSELNQAYDELAAVGDVPSPWTMQPREDAIWLGGVWAYRDEAAASLQGA